MKLILYILAVVLVLLAGVGYAVLTYAGNQLDDASKAYVDTNLPLILGNWSTDELSKRESTDFHLVTSDAELNKLFSILRKLGPLKTYQGCSGNTLVNPTKSGLRITATYIATALFANGNAQIKVSLIQVSGDWQILGFRVNSPLLVQ
jgi:hypothetical protein